MGKYESASFTEKAAECLEKLKYDTSYPSYKNVMNKFIEYYERGNTPIEAYDEEEFKKFAKTTYSTLSTFRSDKSRLMYMLEDIGYPDIAKQLRNVSINAVGKKYIKSFEELDAKIEASRLEKYPMFKDNPERPKCDALTVGQIALYLAWLGIPQKYIPQIPLSAIDLKKQWIDAGRKYSFADNPKMIEVFTTYKNAETYITTRPNRLDKNKAEFRVETYYGNEIIRTKKQNNCPQKDRASSINGIITRLSGHFKFVDSYLSIQRAGQFSRGYENLKSGEKPNFASSESLWKYFRAIIETEAQASTFQREWESYVEWRKETD